jgi:hypothetical protein
VAALFCSCGCYDACACTRGGHPSLTPPTHVYPIVQPPPSRARLCSTCGDQVVRKPRQALREFLHAPPGPVTPRAAFTQPLYFISVPPQPASYPIPPPSVHKDTRSARPSLNTPLNLCSFRACICERCRRWLEIWITGLGDRSRGGSRGHRFAKRAVMHLEAAFHGRDPLRPPHPAPFHPAPPHTARPLPPQPAIARQAHEIHREKDLNETFRTLAGSCKHWRHEAPIYPHPRVADSAFHLFFPTARALPLFFHCTEWKGGAVHGASTNGLWIRLRATPHLQERLELPLAHEGPASPAGTGSCTFAIQLP